MPKVDNSQRDRPKTMAETKEAVLYLIVYHTPISHVRKQNLAIFDSKDKAKAWMEENECDYYGGTRTNGGFGLDIEEFVLNKQPPAPEPMELPQSF
jgi:hypothetical protein